MNDNQEEREEILVSSKCTNCPEILVNDDINNECTFYFCNCGRSFCNNCQQQIPQCTKCGKNLEFYSRHKVHQLIIQNNQQHNAQDKMRLMEILPNIPLKELETQFLLLSKFFETKDYFDYLTKEKGAEFDSYPEFRDLLVFICTYEGKEFNTNVPLPFEICFSNEIRKYELKTIQTYKLDSYFIDWLFDEPTHDLNSLLRDIIYMFNKGKPILQVLSTDYIELQFYILRQCAKDIENEEQIARLHFYKSIFYTYYTVPIILSQPRDESCSSEQDGLYKDKIIDLYTSNFKHLKENYSPNSLRNIFKFGFNNRIFDNIHFFNWTYDPKTFADHVERFLRWSFLD